MGLDDALAHYCCIHFDYGLYINRYDLLVDLPSGGFLSIIWIQAIHEPPLDANDEYRILVYIHDK
jgi:hypothetical protein